MRVERSWAVAALVVIALSGVVGQEPEPGATDDGPVVLSGSLRAAEAERFTVPVSSSWQLTLKWMLAEGEAVEVGDSIARFDPAGTEDQLRQSEETLIAKDQERAREISQSRLRRLELELAHKRAEIEYRKAKLDAAIPQDVLNGVDFRRRQLDMATAKVAFEKSQLELLEHDASAESRIASLDIDLAEERARYERLAEELDSLDLKATRKGLLVHEVHPWWGRKVIEGDRLQATFPVASVPDLATLEVEAWAGETEAARVEIGRRVAMQLDAFPDRPLTGVVRSVASTGERRQSWGRAPYFLIRISLDALDPSIMKPGMSVRCEVES